MISQDKTTGRGEPTVTPCEKKKKEKKIYFQKSIG